MDWYKDNRVIREGGRIRFMFGDDGLCSLLIREAESSDRGRYKCVASNPAGKVQCSAELFIESEYCTEFTSSNVFIFSNFRNCQMLAIQVVNLIFPSFTGHGFDSASGSDYERRLSR